MKLVKDILKTTDPNKSGGDKYSLSRICLLACLISIILINIYSLFNNIDIVFVVDTFYNLIIVFSTYAFGSKAIKGYQDSKNKKINSSPYPHSEGD